MASRFTAAAHKIAHAKKIDEEYRRKRLGKRHEVGLALSGGGIRSAMFCSGVLKTLLDKNVRIDCLSSVSGGGYVAASYVDWKCRNAKKDSPEWHEMYFANMLERASNAYFRYDRSILLGLFDFVVQTVLIILNCFGLSTVSTAAHFLLPSIVLNAICGDYLRARFTTDRADLDIAVVGISWVELNIILIMMATSVVSNIIRSSLQKYRKQANQAVKHHGLNTLMLVLGVYSAILAQACALEVTYLVVAHGVQEDGAKVNAAMELARLAVLSVFVLCWLAFPGSVARRRAVLLVFSGLQAYVVQLRIFDYYYNDFVRDLLDAVTMPAAIVLFIVPLTQPLHDALFFHMYR